MQRQEAVKATLSPQQLEHLWSEYLKGEFESKDVGSNTFASIADISEPPPWLPLRARIRRSERGRRSCCCSDSSSGYYNVEA
jgi:hypothetical protein